MKKKLCLLLFIAFQSIVFGQISFGLSAGYTTNGFAGQASFNHELRTNGYFNGNVFLGRSTLKEGNTPFKTISINLGYYQYVYKNRDETFLFSLGLGGSIAWEIINNGNNILDNGVMLQGNKEDIYGGFLGSEIQYYINDSFMILNTYNLFLLANSDLGNSSVYAGLGLRFYID